jgi:toxin YoeB
VGRAGSKTLCPLGPSHQRNGQRAFGGIGKPEPLKHQFKGYWSRRITDEHRLVYKVTEDAIIIAGCKYHYR